MTLGFMLGQLGGSCSRQPCSPCISPGHLRGQACGWPLATRAQICFLLLRRFWMLLREPVCCTRPKREDLTGEVTGLPLQVGRWEAVHVEGPLAINLGWSQQWTRLAGRAG